MHHFSAFEVLKLPEMQTHLELCRVFWPTFSIFSKWREMQYVMLCEKSASCKMLGKTPPVNCTFWGFAYRHKSAKIANIPPMLKKEHASRCKMHVSYPCNRQK